MVHGVLSTLQNIQAGVPQVSILAPTLNSLYIFLVSILLERLSDDWQSSSIKLWHKVVQYGQVTIRVDYC